MAGMKSAAESPLGADNSVTLFLCGDVMTGRGIDQVLPHPCDPLIFEHYMKSALSYVKIAEAVNGPIPRPVDFSYIWGDALGELDRMAPDLRIINLETSVTTSDDFWPRKGINYRMHPDNTPMISTAGIDCCVLANNHVLDWGYSGLEETLDTLRKAGLQAPGAGRNLEQASTPAIFDLGEKGRVIVFSLASGSSGVPSSWAATHDRAGVNFITDFSSAAIQSTADQVLAIKQPGDIVVLSIHWGSNWGYELPDEQREFAHQLIDKAAIDVIHGHSSHHPRGIEVYRSKPIIYGCGDFVNDYEGISGHDEYRGELSLMYFVSLNTHSGELTGLEMIPMRIRRFQLKRASRKESSWLAATMERESKRFGSSVELREDQSLSLGWGTADIEVSTKVAFLGRPSSYADHPARVEIIQTHMSWVFLTDRFVFKLKKPVRLDFLDFSTLEQRRLNCLKELRLNRRLAREIYLDVIPLTAGDSGQLELGGEAEPVDWLVKMRRLPRECMLDDAIARRQVEESQVRRVARVLADFYRQAKVVNLTTDEYIRQFEQDIQANDRALSEPEYSLPHKQISLISKALQRYLSRERGIFETRVKAQCIVEAHGDLRPEHVCLTDPPVFIDCLEFNRRFRLLDTADELAFLAMECDFAGAPFIGPILFETYRQCSGDDPPQLLVYFYKAYRAQMRAKLSIRHLGGCDYGDSDKWVQRTMAYLHLSARYAEELHG